MLLKKNLQHSLYENIPTKNMQELHRMNAETRGLQYIPTYENNSIGLVDKTTGEYPYELPEYYWHENVPDTITPSTSAREELRSIAAAAEGASAPYNFYRKGDGPSKIHTTHEREYSKLPMFANNPDFKHKIVSDDDMEPIRVTRKNPNKSKFYHFDEQPKYNMSSFISLLSQNNV